MKLAMAMKDTSVGSSEGEALFIDKGYIHYFISKEDKLEGLIYYVGKLFNFMEGDTIGNMFGMSEKHFNETFKEICQ